MIDFLKFQRQQWVIRNRITRALLGSLALVFTSSLTRADSFHFDDASRFGTNSLADGPITASGSVGVNPGNVATGAGLGLGVAGIGGAESVDLVLHYGVGQQYPDNGSGYGLDEHLNLTCDAGFLAITLVPHFPLIQETGLPIDAGFASFGITINWPGFGMAVPQFDPSNAAPVTIDITPSTDFPAPLTSIDLHPDFEGNAAFPQEAQTLSNYRLQHLDEEQTIVLGFSVLSADVVPEPAAGSLVVVGCLVALARWRRQRS